MKTTLLVCNKCNYSTNVKSNYTRHLKSATHVQNSNGKQMETTNDQPTENYKCKCGKIYANRSGLFKHKKKCNGTINKDSEKNK